MTRSVAKANGTGGFLSRRQFLKKAAVAASALAIPYYIPASALGRNGYVAPSERIVLGGIGIGGRGTSDLQWMIAEPDVQFVAVCEVRKQRRDAVKNLVDGKYGNKDCATYRDIREFLVERSDVDAVLIATGDRWHALASIMAMRAGKDVYCEKPSCFTIAEGKMVVDTARNHGRVYQTGTQRLSEANHVFAIEMARSGRLGKLHTVYADIRFRGGSRHDWLPAEPEPPKDEVDWDVWLGPCPWRPYNAGYVSHGWYNFYDFATDVAMWGAHTIAQALAGIDISKISPIVIEYDKASPNMDVNFANGIKMRMIRGGDCWKPCEYWHGSCGERYDGPDGWAAAADGYSKPDVSSPAMLAEYKKILGEYMARTQRPMSHARDFLDCVKSRRPTAAGPEIMYRSMCISIAGDICTRLQRNLKFDMEKAEFVGDDEANRLRVRAMREPWMV
jgi:hypothetical protein